MTFASDLKAFEEKAAARAETVVRKSAAEIFRRVILRTPVGNPDLWERDPPEGYAGGHARANWQASIGRPVSGALDQVDPSGATTVAAAVSLALGWGPKLGASLFLTNNLPYVPLLEYGAWSSQAPEGMVRVTLAEFQNVVSASLEFSKRERP